MHFLTLSCIFSYSNRFISELFDLCIVYRTEAVLEDICFEENIIRYL